MSLDQASRGPAERRFDRLAIGRDDLARREPDIFLRSLGCSATQALEMPDDLGLGRNTIIFADFRLERGPQHPGDPARAGPVIDRGSARIVASSARAPIADASGYVAFADA